MVQFVKKPREYLTILGYIVLMFPIMLAITQLTKGFIYVTFTLSDGLRARADSTDFVVNGYNAFDPVER